MLTEEEHQKLGELCPLLKAVKHVDVTRYYSWKLEVEFDPAPKTASVTCSQLREVIDEAIRQIQELVAPEGNGEALGNIKQAALTTLQQAKDTVPWNGIAIKAQVDQAINAIVIHANEEWQKQLFDPVVALLKEFAQQAGVEEKLAVARQWVEAHLPKFIYFDRYDVIDSAIHIPSFASQAANNQGGARVRTSHCLFKHVGLDVNQLVSLGRHQPGQGEDDHVRRQVDERAILVSSASNAMTRKFEDWWEQRKHQFHYQVDGDYFHVWVSDDLDPSEIELDQRSAGMQYFFSFFIVFLVEVEGAHANSILLLDEPGLHLHGTAQAKIVRFLEKLSRDNQTFYTTRSPFLVDVDHLERARALYEDENGTTMVSEDVWPRDKDSLFPLQAALGYQLAQGLFIAKRQLIVEGLIDFWLLKALDQALAVRGRTGLRPDIIIVPGAGLAKLVPLASMLIGHQVEIAVLLDGDEPARKEGKKLAEKLLVSEGYKCLFIGDFVGSRNAEIEDIFPGDDYLSTVKEAYPHVDLIFTDEEKMRPGVVNKIEALFERKNLGRFEKWRPAVVLRDRILGSPSTIADQTLDVVEKIYQSVNALFIEHTADLALTR